LTYDILKTSPVATPDYTSYGVCPELLVYDHEFKIAGQADVVLKMGKSISILDYKTSKTIEKVPFQDQRLLGPLSHLPNANFYIYAMQLSIYGYLLERQGYEVGRLQIHHIDRNTFNLIECHDTNYYRNEAETLIKHYCNERDKKTRNSSIAAERQEETVIVPLED
jgi:hypothetical protein